MLNGLLFERIETRILVGISMFVAILVLVGWVAINETGRMAAYTQQTLARSIEQGAALFASRCTTCHGVDARGKPGIAPGLNNPQLFGFDYFAANNKKLTALQDQEAKLHDQEKSLSAQLLDPNTAADQKAAINKQLADISAQLSLSTPDSVSASILTLQSQNQTMLDAMQSAEDKGYNPQKPARLENVKWGGSLNAFIFTTLVQGRPVSSNYWPNPMPTWSQTGGGPLRDDQLQDLANYVLNFDKGNNWTLDDLLAVQQFAIEPVEPGAAGPAVATVGTDVKKIVADLATVTGDAKRGDALYHGTERTGANKKLICASCHQGGTSAPSTEGTWTRIQGVRLKDPKLAGYTPEQYIVESVTQPGAYVVSGYSVQMPNYFGQQLTTQDLADIIAFLKTQQ
jgi:mono/diheme cytochrome c family protein